MNKTPRIITVTQNIQTDNNTKTITDPSLTPSGCHTLHQIAYELKKHQQANPKDILIIVGASFSWPAKLSQALHQLKHIQLIFSGNIFSYNKETNQYEHKHNMGREQFNEFKKHCIKIGLTPQSCLKHPISLFDMIKSGAGLLSVKTLLIQWILESYGRDPKNPKIPSLKSKRAIDNINLLYFQDPNSKSDYPVQKLPGYEYAKEIQLSANPHTICQLADNDINRLVPSNKAAQYQNLKLHNSIEISAKLYALTQFSGPKRSIESFIAEHTLASSNNQENWAIVPYKN